jgi:hypothetical protein
MAPDGGGDSAIERSIRRLDRVMTLLDQRITRQVVLAQAQTGSLVDADRARLATELDAARGRERDLEAAGAEASLALAEAIAQLREVLGDQDPAKEG